MSIIYKLPILYIKSNNKKRFWKIWLSKEDNKIYIKREYGIEGGKITIPEPKIIKTLEKAKTQMNSLWRKKKESGFTESKNNNEIKHKTSTIKPMGAHKLDDHYHKIKYPAYVQTKLDGFRCLSTKNNSVEMDGIAMNGIAMDDIAKNGIAMDDIAKNDIAMYSKGMKKFTFLKHIKAEIAKITELTENIYLDGELYENGLKLHNISSLVMKKYATAEDENAMKKISYYIFDIFDLANIANKTFEIRYNNLKNIFKKYKFKYLKLVTCQLVNSYPEIQKINDKYLYEGYEGIIVRNLDGLYKLNSKSYDVLRTKEFKRKEFKIDSAKEGTGTQKGAIIWKLKCNNDKTFWAIPIGTIKDRIIQYNDYKKYPDKYIGHNAIVKFLELDNNGCVSRNPIVEQIL